MAPEGWVIAPLATRDRLVDAAIAPDSAKSPVTFRAAVVAESGPVTLSPIVLVNANPPVVVKLPSVATWFAPPSVALPP